MAKDAKSKPAEAAAPTAGKAYTVLARKYRSRTFDEVVGQEHVAQTLKKAIETGRVHHAYLFCGTRGVGKTSMARILALALNDPTADSPTAQPDPTTETADAIFKGDDVDVIEIDAASNTGVDNVRDLIENARFRPMRSRFKVYIIDEVHMLSKAAFNALLKIMEEPPEHVKFILATTEPEKVLATILSRVQRFDFRNIPVADVVGHLKDVLKREKVSADEDALRLVARNGGGSMRDALSLLDRLISGLGEGENLTTDDVTRLLGLPPGERVFALVNAFGEGDAKAALSQADAILSAGQSADSLVGALIDHLHALLVRTVAGGGELADLPGLDAKAVGEQADKFEADVLAQDVAILEELRRQMRSSGAGRALLDATLVRLALAEQFTPVADLLAGGAAPAKRAEKKTADLASALPAEPRDAGAATVATLPGVSDPAALWSGLKRVIAADYDTMAPLLQGGRIDAYDEARHTLHLGYHHSASNFASMLERGGKKEKLAASFAKLIGIDEPPAVDISVDEAPPSDERGRPVDEPNGADFATPPAANAPPSELDLEAEPLVQAAIRELGARVVKVEDD